MKKLLAALLFIPAVALGQLTVSDGTVRGTCTAASIAAGTVTFTPSGCLGTQPSVSGPSFSVRFDKTSVTQDLNNQVYVTAYVDVDRDVQRAAHDLTFNYCVSENGCDPNVPQPNSPQTVFYRYGGLGGTDFGQSNMFNTLRQPFKFIPGDGQAASVNMRTMGVGVVVVFPVSTSPRLNAVKTVTASITGAGAQPTIATLTINPPTQVSTNDVDINGTPIPNTPVSYVASGSICEYLGQPGKPGPFAHNPCGAYQMQVDSCSSGMSGTEAITRAYMLPIEDYDPTSGRLGNSIRMSLPQHAAMSFRMRTKAPEIYGNLWPRPFQIGFDEFMPNGAHAVKFVTISEKRCDFDYNKVDLVGGIKPDSFCYKSDASGAIIGRITPTGNEPNMTGYCQLKPNTTYYLNVRFEDARPGARANRGKSSCPTGIGYHNDACGTVININ